MQEGDGDSEMTPSDIGTEDPYLRDIVEKEGIDLQNILEQWKKTRYGQHTIRTTRSHSVPLPNEGGRKIKRNQMNAWRNTDPGYQGGRQSTTTLSKERKGEEIALQELGALLINSGKIKKLFPTSPPNV
jgi:hypothetical protein